MGIKAVSFKIDQDEFYKAKYVLKKRGQTMTGFINLHLTDIIDDFENNNWKINSEDAKKALNIY